jgi:membrane protein YqaA with SNARE-associated domain
MPFLQTITHFVNPAARRLKSLQRVLAHLGLFGLFLLAIVDSSPIPTFGGLDILTAILAARRREPWYYYAGIATMGSVIGAYLTFRMAHKAGLEYLKRKFGQRRVSKVQQYFERWGMAALAVSTVVPLPFPTSAFFAIAGALDYPLRTFMVVVALCRALRYGAIAAVSSHYGRRFIVGLRHPERHHGWLLGIAVAVVVITTAALFLKDRTQSNHRDTVKTGAT